MTTHQEPTPVVAGKVSITPPGGSPVTLDLDRDGIARLEDIERGACKVSFEGLRPFKQDEADKAAAGLKASEEKGEHAFTDKNAAEPAVPCVYVAQERALREEREREGKWVAVRLLEKKKESWIAVKLLKQDGSPAAGEAYEIHLPDGSTVKGSLDGAGCALLPAVTAGKCRVTFPGVGFAQTTRDVYERGLRSGPALSGPAPRDQERPSS